MPARNATKLKANTAKTKIVISSFTLMLLLLTLFNIYKSLLPSKIIVLTAPSKDNKWFWNETIMKYPSYRDAYIELAKLSLIDGDYEISQSMLTKALKLDPFSVEAKEISKVLGM